MDGIRGYITIAFIVNHQVAKLNFSLDGWWHGFGNWSDEKILCKVFGKIVQNIAFEAESFDETFASICSEVDEDSINTSTQTTKNSSSGTASNNSKVFGSPHHFIAIFAPDITSSSLRHPILFGQFFSKYRLLIRQKVKQSYILL